MSIDDFNESAAKILAKLYETFPQLQTLVVSDLAERTDENKFRTYYGTIVFLQREGIIHYTSQIATDSFNDVLLTSKGLAILNTIPDALQERVSLGTKLVNAVKDGSQAVMKISIEELIKNVMGR